MFVTTTDSNTTAATQFLHGAWERTRIVVYAVESNDR
jgi:hypothetical protein